MIPQALDALADELARTDNPNRYRIACEILRLAKLPDIVPKGPADPEIIVRRIVNEERQQARGALDFLAEQDKGLAIYEEHMAQKWAELEAKAAEQPERLPSELSDVSKKTK
jgi:hypothetical protein